MIVSRKARRVKADKHRAHCSLYLQPLDMNYFHKGKHKQNAKSHAVFFTSWSPFEKKFTKEALKTGKSAHKTLKQTFLTSNNWVSLKLQHSDVAMDSGI
jgi:hypothetical protein